MSRPTILFYERFPAKYTCITTQKPKNTKLGPYRQFFNAALSIPGWEVEGGGTRSSKARGTWSQSYTMHWCHIQSIFRSVIRTSTTHWSQTTTPLLCTVYYFPTLPILPISESDRFEVEHICWAYRIIMHIQSDMHTICIESALYSQIKKYNTVELYTCFVSYVHFSSSFLFCQK